VPRAGVGILDEDDYLTPGEREARSAAKRRALRESGLTPDWFRGQGTLCLPPTRVAIIGGGFAGLAAAWYLDQCGVDTVVYEARSQVGGRVLTNSSFVSGKVVEAGAELIGENHPLWIELADRFRLRLEEITDDSDYEKAGLTVRIRFGSHDLTPAEKRKLKGNLKPILTTIGREARPIHQSEPWRPPATPALDAKTVATRLNELLVVAPSFERAWFDFTLGNDNCADVAKQSYLGLLGAVSAHRMGSDDKGMLGYWMSTETHRCAAGNQALATAIAKSLPDVRLSTVVTDVEIERMFIVTPVRIVSSKTTPTGVVQSQDDFDFAILAAPPTVWSGITFKPGLKAATRQIQHGPAVKFLSRFTTRFWEDPSLRLAPSAKWNQLGSVWEGTDKQGTPPDFCLSIFSGGPFVLPRSSYPTQLATIYPGASAAATLFADWPSEPFISTGYGVPAPGQVMKIGPAQLLPHSDRLYFAGEQTSLGYFGYMEGALQSGTRAARDIVVRWARRCDGSILAATASPTAVAGASIKRIRGDDYVVAIISRLFPGPPPTIAGLAAALHLQTDLTLHALLGYRANAPAVIGLYRDQIGGEMPDLEEARRRLTIAATTFTASNDFPDGTETPYVNWPVEPDGDKPVVVPLSREFRKVIEEATRQRQRQTRLRAIAPALDALGGELDPIHDKAVELTSDVQLCKDLTQANAPEVALLEALDGMLGAMLAFPKAAVDPGDRRDVEQLRTLLGTLKTEAQRNMILDPPDSFKAGMIKRRDANAAALRAMIEDASFVEHVRVLAANRDIAPSDLWQRTLDVVRLAVQALLVSPESDRVLDAHVLPMIDQLASRPFDLTGLSASKLPEFDRGFREVPASPPANSVLVILVGTAGMVPLAVGNYPGPNTLAVCILDIAAPLLMARVVGNVQAAGTLGGRLYRALVTTASVYSGAGGQPLSLNQRVTLIEAINDGDLARLRNVNWSSRFMNSPAWGSAIAIASAICLIAAIDSDDASTLRKWSNITGSASGVALGVSVALGRYSTLVEQGIIRGIGGKALGVIGGVAAVVSGVVTAEEAYHSGDTVGMWVSIGAATGGALSVAGFLVAAGAGTTATVAGAPVGVLLMAAGAIVGIGAGVVALVRSLLTSGSQVVFGTFIDHFGRPGGPYDTAANDRPSLRAAFTAVQTAHHPVDFWDVDPTKIPQLFDLGFGEPHIAQIVDEDAAVVNNSLVASKRIT
jgi:monoamine oxidase